MFDLSDRGQDYRDRLLAFMDEHVYPAESVYREQMRESGDHEPIEFGEVQQKMGEGDGIRTAGQANQHASAGWTQCVSPDRPADLLVKMG